MARLDFANARIGARRGRLLGAPGVRELLACASQEARVAVLRGRAMGATLPAELGDDPTARVEAALREGWRREAAALVAQAEGKGARALLAAFLALDEAAAFKAILRGVALGLTPERTLAGVPPATEPGEGALRAAASAHGVEHALEVLAEAGSALAGPVRAALPLRDGGGLLPLELAADRAALARAAAACRGHGEDAALLRRHLADRVDARNAATLLALAGAAPVEDPFLAGGSRLSLAALRDLAAAPAPRQRAALARAFAVPEAELATPWSADRALERALAAPLRREARLRPLSLAVPLSYLADRRAEVRRVALVLRGTELGLAAAELLALAEA